ncbi:hypothetical protein OAA60_04455 [Porticoccaceae bacterium]|nr:hypothetical protein [Porticoccaceae bacterium]
MGAAVPQVVTESSASGAQVIDGSLKFDDTKSQFLKRTPSSAGNRKTWTWSAWVKKSAIITSGDDQLFASDSTAGNEYNGISFVSTNQLNLRFSDNGNLHIRSNAVHRDPSAFLHVVCVVDTTQSTSSDRLKMYVNGSQITSFVSSGYPSLNAEGSINSSIAHAIGRREEDQLFYFDGKLSQVTFLDGLALGPENFGFTDPLTNTWRPKKYTGDFNIAAESYSTDIGVFTIGNTTPNADSTVAYLNSNPDSSSYPLIQSSQSSNNTIRVKFASAQNGVTSIKFRGGGYASGSTYTLFVNGTQVGGTHSTNSLWAEDSHTISSTNITELKIIGSDGFALGQLKFDDSLVSGTVSYGTEATGVNSFYLPMDGNSPIGQDKSGQGNDWTPVNFGGSVALDNPIVSGALPILNTIQGGAQAGVGVRTDAYHANLVLALPLVGSANDVSNSVNSGSTTKAVTSTNAVASSAASNFYGGSWYFDGTGDYLTIPYAADTFSFGTGDFTIEAYVNMSAVNYTAIISSTNTSINATNHWLLGFSNTANMMSFKIDGSGNSSVTSDFSGYYSKWTHVAVSRESGTIRLFFDGVLKASATDTSDLTGDTGNAVKIGQRYTNQDAYSINGYMQDLRVYKGVAKYTSNFVVPSTSPDILPDTPSGVSGGSKLAKVTDGAVNFNASGDKLTVPNSSGDFDFGSGDFTIESYLYMTAESGGDAIISLYNYSSNRRAWNYYYQSSDGSFEFLVSTTGSNQIKRLDSPVQLPQKRWVHVAVTKASNVYRMFYDGVEVTNATQSETIFGTGTTADSVGIGDYAHTNGEPYSGFISNIRILKGTALYTANFTPPTRELTNVTNTKLLCCQSNTLAGSAAVVPGASGINDGTPWSEFVTIPEGVTGTNYNDDASGAFDGGTSTYTSLYSGNMVAPYSPTTVVFTPPSPISVSSGLRVYMQIDRGQKIFVNGTQTNASVSAGWNDTSFTGTLTSLTIGPSNLGSSSNISAIEVDSVILKNLVLPKGNAAATNFNPFNTDINTVRGQETGYATWNPLSVRSGVTFEGNLTLTNSGSGASGWRNVACTQSVTSGKWYVEMHTIGSQNGGLMPGVCKLPDDQGTFNPGTFSNNFPGMTANSYALNCFSGSKRTNGSDASYGSGMAAGDLIMMCLDLDNGAIWWGKNGVWFAGGDPAANSNAAFTGLTGEFVFACGISANEKIVTNFGQKSYKYAPPAGFQPLNAANAKPVKVITRPDQFVGVVAYTGDGNSPREIGGFGFQPDLVVYKERSEARDWQWYDSVRGVGPAKNLVSNTTYAETANDDTQYGYTSSFNKDGFTVTNGTGGGNANIYTNKSGQTYASWTWRAGGNKNTFNVDDVGYASAADVNMSVGSLNSASYNQDQTWSSTSGMSTPANAFDGSFSTGATVSSSGSPITVTTGSFTASSISFYKNGNNDANLATITINDTSVFSFPLQSTATGWVTVNIGSEVTVTSLKTTWYGAYTLYAVKADDKLLVDNGVSVSNVPSIANTGASVGTKQGFSIVGFTDGGSACNIAHGLTKAPDFYIVKFRGASGNWSIYHKSLGNTKRLKFTTDDSGSADAGWWQNTSPTSSVFYLGGNLITSTTQIAYLWHDVPGLQKFGSYVGNGNSDGPFIELGFRPAVIFLKRTDSASSWQVRDTTRSPHNVVTQNLYPNLSNAESTDSSLNLDILSNGFKPRTSTDGGSNANNGTYIYAAWAEAPTFNLFGAQSNAR